MFARYVKFYDALADTLKDYGRHIISGSNLPLELVVRSLPLNSPGRGAKAGCSAAAFWIKAEFNAESRLSAQRNEELSSNLAVDV
jgi:hypothetical protein